MGIILFSYAYKWWKFAQKHQLFPSALYQLLNFYASSICLHLYLHVYSCTVQTIPFVLTFLKVRTQYIVLIIMIYEWNLNWNHYLVMVFYKRKRHVYIKLYNQWNCILKYQIQIERLGYDWPSMGKKVEKRKPPERKKECKKFCFCCSVFKRNVK